MKLIFHYGDLYRHHPKKGVSVTLPRCFLIGQLTEPYEVEPLGSTGTFFVCFTPNGFRPFSSLPIRELSNTAVPLAELFGAEGQEFAQKILAATGTAERIETVEGFLRSRLAATGAVDNVIKSTVEAILTANGRLSVAKLSEQENIHRRQLSRKLSSATGLSPKQLSKIIRLQAALKAMKAGKDTSLTDLAYENEYFDQAHFIKDFKEFTGLTPKEFYGDHLEMSLVFEKKN